MLTVWCVCWGDKYPDYYVQRLQRTVRENLWHPHEFVCITDRHIPNVVCRPFEVDYPGWWAKVGLFKGGSGQNLFLDLDVVITGDLTEMVQRYKAEPLAMPLNWAQSGHGGCQSSVILWSGCDMTRRIYDEFDPDYIHWPPTPPWKFYGDQEWITHLRDTGRVQVTPIDAGIYSYKYHVRGKGLPHRSKIIVFHGEPKPPDVKESWFQW